MQYKGLTLSRRHPAGDGMKNLRTLLLLAPLLAGCLAGVRPAVVAPLESEAEVLLELQPLPADAVRLAFSLQGLFAVRHDGGEVPLELALAEVAGAEPARARPWARGRLEPGSYLGFSLHFLKATLAGEGKPSDLLVPPEPVRVDIPFVAAARRTVLVRVSLGPGGAVEEGHRFAPAFTAELAQRPLAQLSGFCSDGARHAVGVFDKRAHRLGALLPTGRAPWGLALDPLQNRLYVALSEEDEVQVFDVAAGAEVGRIRLQPGDAPRELALTPDQRTLLVADAGSNTVSFVDPLSLQELARVPVGEAPTSLLVDRTGLRAYVFNARSSFVSVLDLANRAVVGSIGTDYGPLRGQLNRAGTRLYVVANNSSYLTAYALPAGTQAGRVYVGLGTTALKVDPRRDLLYVAQGGANRLAVFDPFSLVPVDFIEVPGDGAWLAIDDAEDALFVLLPERGSVAVVGLTGRRLLDELDAGASPRVLVLSGERN